MTINCQNSLCIVSVIFLCYFMSYANLLFPYPFPLPFSVTFCTTTIKCNTCFTFSADDAQSLKNVQNLVNECQMAYFIE